jgi:hypothetical protein
MNDPGDKASLSYGFNGYLPTCQVVCYLDRLRPDRL